MEAISKEMQGLIEFESKNKSRSRGTRIEDVNFYARISIQPEITQKAKVIVCNSQRKTFIENYKEIRKK